MQSSTAIIEKSGFIVMTTIMMDVKPTVLFTVCGNCSTLDAYVVQVIWPEVNLVPEYYGYKVWGQGHLTTRWYLLWQPTNCPFYSKVIFKNIKVTKFESSLFQTKSLMPNIVLDTTISTSIGRETFLEQSNVCLYDRKKGKEG